MVATDGEAQRLETPLRYRVRPGALKLTCLIRLRPSPETG